MIVIPSFRGLVARVFATSASGSLFAWGYNGQGIVPASGQLGLGDSTNRSSPAQVGSGTNWSKISSGKNHTLAIRDGKLYAWGDNQKGQVGKPIVSSNSYNSPVPIGSDTNWSMVSAGNRHSLAVKSNGTLWSWGYNSNGQLGLGDSGNYAHRSSPVQVGSQTNWSSVSAGWYHSLAIRNDGSLWAWGSNSSYQLGLGDYSPRSLPTQVAVGTSWVMVSAGGRFNKSHSLGIKSDGTLWSWGSNSYGQLGLGTSPGSFVYYISPFQVGANSDWLKISAGGYHSFGIRGSGASGTLWSWGRNNHGQLGLSNSGSGTDRSKPVQIGSSNWTSISAGEYHSGGINSSEKLFFWGFNNKGQIGDITTVSKNSPVAIMSSANFIYSASMKDGSSFAIKKQ